MSAVVNVAVAGGVLVADWRKSGFVGFKFECMYAKKNRIEQKRKEKVENKWTGLFFSRWTGLKFLWNF